MASSLKPSRPVRSRITARKINSTTSKPSLNRRHLQSVLHRGTVVEPCLHVKKAIEADELARFEKPMRLRPGREANIGDAVVSAHHPVAAREPFVEDTEQPR